MIVNIHDAKTHLSKLIARFLDGEDIVIAKNGKPIVKLAPVGDEPPNPRPLGFFNCDVDMSAFDDPIEELKAYQ